MAFDRTITETSTSGDVALSITAGTEGVKNNLATLHVGAQSFTMSLQKLMDILEPGAKAYAAASGQ